MKQLFSTTIAIAVFSPLVCLPTIAQANPESPFLITQTLSTPQIDSFSVNPISQLTPGSELVFTLQGTPNSKATLTIESIVRNLPMQEVEPGVYEGRYTIRSRDSITADIPVRANLQQNNRLSSVRLQQPLTPTVANANQTTSGQNGGSQTTGTTDQTAQPPLINRFTVQPVQKLEPGTELNFTLTGTPNATATFSIEGIAYNQPMQEASKGTYQGRYVIRQQDDFPTSGARVTASLQSRNQVVRARLDQELAIGNGVSTSQLPLEITSPANNTRVKGTVEVRGRSVPNTTVNVSVQAKTSLAGLIGFDQNILTRTVETDAQGGFSFTFKPTISVPGTQYQISLNARKGNQQAEETLVLLQQ